MVQKDFSISKTASRVLLSVLSLVILVGTIVAAVLFEDTRNAVYPVLMWISLFVLLAAYTANFSNKALSEMLYGANVLLTILVFIIYTVEYPRYGHLALPVLLLTVLNLLCIIWISFVSSVVSVNDEVVLFQGDWFKKYLMCSSINVVRRGLFRTVTIKTASGKIRVPFVKDADQLVDFVLNVCLGHECQIKSEMPQEESVDEFAENEAEEI